MGFGVARFRGSIGWGLKLGQRYKRYNWRLYNVRDATSSSKSNEEPRNLFKRLVSVLLSNRQAVINVAGMYFVLSYAVYNYKVKLAWEDLQVGSHTSLFYYTHEETHMCT